MVNGNFSLKFAVCRKRDAKSLYYCPKVASTIHWTNHHPLDNSKRRDGVQASS